MPLHEAKLLIQRVELRLDSQRTLLERSVYDLLRHIADQPLEAASSEESLHFQSSSYELAARLDDVKKTRMGEEFCRTTSAHSKADSI